MIVSVFEAIVYLVGGLLGGFVAVTILRRRVQDRGPR